MNPFLFGFFLGTFFPKHPHIASAASRLLDIQYSYRYLIIIFLFGLMAVLLKHRIIHHALGYLMSYFIVGFWWGYIHNPARFLDSTGQQICHFRVFDPYTQNSQNQFLCITGKPMQILKMTKMSASSPTLSPQKKSVFHPHTIFSQAISQSSLYWKAASENDLKTVRGSALSRLSPNNIDLLSSLGFGYSFGRLKNLSQSLKILGIFHMLVLSGAQISIIASAVGALNFLVLRFLLIFRFLKPHRFLTIYPVWKFIGALGVLYYISLTNITPPVQRAALMFLCSTYTENLGLKLPRKMLIKIVLIAHVMIFPINFFSFSSLLTWLCYFYLIATQMSELKSKFKKYVFLQSLNLSLIAGLFCDLSFIGFIFNFCAAPIFTLLIFLAFLLSPLPPYFWGADFFLSHIDYILSKFCLFILSSSEFARSHFWLYVKIPEDWLVFRFCILVTSTSFFFFLFKQLNTPSNNCYDIANN